MQIVRAKPEDADALTEIAHAAKRHWGYPERWIEAWRDILTMRPEFIAANVAYCAMEDDNVVGFYVLTTENDGVHLDHLWIIPAAMRRGIGRVIRNAVDQARSAGLIRSDRGRPRTWFPSTNGWARSGYGTSVGEVEGEKRELPVMEYRDFAGRNKLVRAPCEAPIDESDPHLLRRAGGHAGSGRVAATKARR